MPAPPDPIDEISRRFEVRMAEEHAGLRPADTEALRALAYAYTAAERYEDALKTDRALVAREPTRADFRYDLACSYALLHRADEAFDALDEALSLGFDDWDCLLEDDDLLSLREDARWAPLVGRRPS